MARFIRPRAGGIFIALLAAAAIAAPSPAGAAAQVTAVPASAAKVTATATVTVPGKCYASWPNEIAQTIPIRVTGLPPGLLVKVELRIAGQTVSGLPSLLTDSTGSVITELKSWTTGLKDGPSRRAQASIVITDFLMGTELASTSLYVTNVGLDIDSSTQEFGTKRRWIVSGLSLFGGGSSYYAHYFKGSKEIAKVRIGAADATCGYLRIKRELMPFRRLGTFIVSVQASRVFNKDLPSMSYKIRGFAKK